MRICRTIPEKSPFADFGCSNGFLTNEIVERFQIQDASGFDVDYENIAVAAKRYPAIQFQTFNLNMASEPVSKFLFITCLETMEHVGNQEVAFANLIRYLDTKGRLIISVPIEIGLVGISKFIIKRFVYGYSFSELNTGRYFTFRYLKDLIFRKDISRYRKPADSYGTHFGFDYRTIDKLIYNHPVYCKTFNSFTTRYYIISFERI